MTRANVDDKTGFCDPSGGMGAVFWSYLLIWAAEGLGRVWDQQTGDGEGGALWRG